MNCLHRHEPYHRFCSECGKSIARKMCACGCANEIDNRFCVMCGSNMIDASSEDATSVLQKRKIRLADLLSIEKQVVVKEGQSKSVSQSEIDRLMR